MLSFMFFYALKKNNRLRVDYIYEIIGLDFVKHQSEGSIYMHLLEEEERKEFFKQNKKVFGLASKRNW